MESCPSRELCFCFEANCSHPRFFRRQPPLLPRFYFFSRAIFYGLCGASTNIDGFFRFFAPIFDFSGVRFQFNSFGAESTIRSPSGILLAKNPFFPFLRPTIFSPPILRLALGGSLLPLEFLRKSGTAAPFFPFYLSPLQLGRGFLDDVKRVTVLFPWISSRLETLSCLLGFLCVEILLCLQVGLFPFFPMLILVPFFFFSSEEGYFFFFPDRRDGPPWIFFSA